MKNQEESPRETSSDLKELNKMYDATIQLHNDIHRNNKDLIKVLEGTIVSQSWKITQLESEVRIKEIEIERLRREMTRKRKRDFLFNWFIKKFKA